MSKFETKHLKDLNRMNEICFPKSSTVESESQQLLTQNENKTLLFLSKFKNILTSFQSIMEEICLSETSQKIIQFQTIFFNCLSIKKKK